mmetsp:Transcript_65400/g.147543  ORF Transcript_65400/g.147543 Transcript_65400/m.147543 type:complete len:247 (-) Transcript_65400:2176-2916(-)
MRSSRGGPCSTTLPSERTRIESQKAIVLSRWAMVSTVALPRKSRRTISCRAASVSGSTLAVASSITRTFGSRSRARAMQSSCRSPPLRLAPPSATKPPRPPIDRRTLAAKPARSRAAHMAPSNTSHSAASPSHSAARLPARFALGASRSARRSARRAGSRLYLTVPRKRHGSWATRAIWDLRASSDSVRWSAPSNLIVPRRGSTKRKSAATIDDLPAPVRPQMPSLERAGTVKVTSRRTGRKGLDG